MQNKIIIFVATTFVVATAYYTLFTSQSTNHTSQDIRKSTSQKTHLADTDIAYEKTTSKDKEINKEYNYSNINPLLDDLLQKVTSNNIDSLSSDDIFDVSRFLQESTGNLNKEYQKIESVYKKAKNDTQKSFLLYLLGDIGSTESAQTLLSIVDSDTNPTAKIQYESAKAIRDLAYDKEWNSPNKEVSPVLEEYLDNSSNTMYTYDIADTLTRIGEPSATEVVVNQLESADTQTHHEIASTLKNVLNEDATAVLVDRYNNPNASDTTKVAILDSLSYQPNKNAADALYDYASNLSSDSDIEDVVTRFETLKQHYPKSENIIKEKLYDKSTDFKSEAIRDAIEDVYKKKDNK